MCTNIIGCVSSGMLQKSSKLPTIGLCTVTIQQTITILNFLSIFLHNFLIKVKNQFTYKEISAIGFKKNFISGPRCPRLNNRHGSFQ